MILISELGNIFQPILGERFSGRYQNVDIRLALPDRHIREAGVQRGNSWLHRRGHDAHIPSLNQLECFLCVQFEMTITFKQYKIRQNDCHR